MNKQAVMSFASPLAGKFVKRAPLIAGNAPESCAEGKLVKFAPLPVNDVAVTTPVACTPEVI